MITSFLKRHPSSVFFAVWLGCAVAGFLLPKTFSIVEFVDKWLADIRLTTAGATMQTHPDIVLFTITEDTLAPHPYRFPIDRGMLADAIDRFNEAGVRAIGLDILFDQSTEPDKDKRLGKAVSESAAPVIVGWASKADSLTEKQVAHLKGYLPDAIHAPSNVIKDGVDGTVRWIYPGVEKQGGYRPAFASALAKVVGKTPSKEAINLYFRRGSDGSVTPFRIFPLHLLKDLPKSWYAGKIVLIGADLPNEDRHRTPFAALLGNDAGSLPGVVVHAFALAQLLDGVSFSRQDVLASLIATLAASGLGVVIALLGIGVFARLMLGGLAYLAFWGTGFGLFALTGWLIPLFAPSLALAGAGSLSVAVTAQRYKRKKQFAEAMVHRRNESLHKVVENSFDGIIVTTSDGRITMTNSSADYLMGWIAGETVGTPVTDFIPSADDIGAHFLELDHSPDRSSERNIEPLEVPCERADGSSFTMELVVYTTRVSFTQGDSSTTGGERVSYIYSFRDITVRKRAEEAQKEALTQSEAANRAKTEFLANMSHELRTPLNAIIGFSEIMKMEALGPIGTPQYVEYVEDIHNSGSHLIEIVNDILDMSKIEAGDIELNEEPCDVFQMADTCMRLVADRAQNGEVALVNTMASDLPRLLADQRMVKQILLNLLSNAVKFTPADGTVTLSASVDGAGLTVSVSDTGCGIPAEKMKVILEPFGQADMSLQRQFEGTGLGLPLAKGLAELHGGSLNIESTEGKGTTASVSLPADRFVSEQKTA